MKFPIFFNHSLVPVALSKVSPIEIGAISLGLFVFSRGIISDVTRRHETIHYRQWRELGFVFFPLLYAWFHVLNRARGMDGDTAYHANPFEREAYLNEFDEEYLSKRKHFAWLEFTR